MRGLEIDLFDQDSERSLLDTASIILTRILSSGENELRCKIWPALDGHKIDIKDCSLRVVPLHRLGAAEGKSSASVFVAYFIAEAGLWPSHPLIVKLSRPDSTRDACAQEYKDAESLKYFIGHAPTGYAAPLLCYESTVTQPYSVLWSPFASADDIWVDVELHEGRLNLRVEDIWKLLTSATLDIDLIKNALKLAFEFLWPLHRKGGKSKAETRKYSDEYGPYLRKIGASEWSDRWRNCWGPDTAKAAKDFGQEWVNPFNVLSRLQNREAKMFCGGIHGDLHPKNIVLSRGIPRIIDFGWASSDAHIAKDFVLFECNLRFVTLPASVPYDDVVKLAESISFDSDIPTFSSPELQKRLQLVAFIRDQARRAFPPETDWDMEYVVPMFFVAIGLLKHSDDFSSQVSTRQHVLQLANYISEKVLPKYETSATSD